jgi:hypothetical protein
LRKEEEEEKKSKDNILRKPIVAVPAAADTNVATRVNRPRIKVTSDGFGKNNIIRGRSAPTIVVPKQKTNK